MRRPICIFGLAYVVIILIYLYFQPFPAVFPGELDGSTVTLAGRVDKKEYRISNDQTVLILYLKQIQFLTPQTENIQSSDSQHENDLSQIEGILCYLKEGREPRCGSYVQIRGKLRGFDEATNPGEFDAQNYYQILNLQARLTNGILIEESADYDAFRERLWNIKCYLSQLLESCYDAEDASVMKAMLLGEKSGLDEEIKQLYQLNGIIHILSISGLHISMIGMGLHKLLHKLRCPKAANILFSIGFMYSYGIMTGMSVSAVRAIVMFGFHVAAGLFGRTYDMLTAMAVAGIFVLTGQPLYLYHSGFLFSFLAILSIGLLSPVLMENLLGESKLEKLMSTNLSVSLITFPVYLYFYYEYPLYSLLLNLIIIPAAGLIVTDGLISLTAAMCSATWGAWAALPARLLLAFYKFCCMLTLRLPGSRNILGKPEIWQVCIFAAAMCAAVFCSKRWSKLQFWQCILLALLCITLRFQEGMQITVLDVGQGDGIYIADEQGGHYLIDGGSSSKSDVGTYQILPFLKEEGAEVLDAVFVTHMDSDHYNGIYTLIERMNIDGITINNLILPDVGEGSKGEEYRELEALAAEQGISIRYIHRGATLQHGRLKLTCLHPEKGTEAETNEASIVLYMEYGAFSALFTGDLEGEGEEEVRRFLEAHDPEGREITLLKVAHHGSKNSTREAFLETVCPKLALISAGRNNRYGHPHEELLRRLEDCGCFIYRTQEGGALTVRVRNGKVRVEGFLECN